MSVLGSVRAATAKLLIAGLALSIVTLVLTHSGAEDALAQSRAWDRFAGAPGGAGSAHTPQAGRGHVTGARSAFARLIADTADLLTGPRAEGQIGDYLLENTRIAMVVESAEHNHGYGLSGGNIVDAAPSQGRSDELELVLAMLEEFPRQAVYDTVYVESDGSTGEAVVVARGVDSWNAAVRVTTEYSLGPDDPFVTIRTTVLNLGENLVDYDVGDIIQWGDTHHYAPGYGHNIDWITISTQWLGGVGSDVCYGYTISEGSLLVESGTVWSDPFVASADLATGESFSYERFLVVGHCGLASASDVIHDIRGMDIGTVAGTVLDEATSEPVAGATINCLLHGTTPYTVARSDSSGSYSATLYPYTHTLEVSHPDYYTEEESVAIALSETARADILLESPAAGAPVGDTLTVIMQPIMSVPQIVPKGGDISIDARAPSTASGWRAWLVRGTSVHETSVTSTDYSPGYERWFIEARVPTDMPAELYSLMVTASGGVSDRADNAVNVVGPVDEDFYFVHITDTHLPTHLFYEDPGSSADTSEMEDLRAVIEDVNLINPAFVVITGDLINEGELEDFESRRVFTKTQRLLKEFGVPVFITAGNHDVGGWTWTPPPDGTARRTWWRFFGWPYLESPPLVDEIYTQNYSFDYGGAHFVGLEAYDNYDGWRSGIYGSESFTHRQIEWLHSDLELADRASAKIVFYHYDFQHELDLDALGIDLALWGHIHSSSGSIASPPYDLSTGPVCDGRRRMRLIRVHANTVLPSDPISAGTHGDNLTLAFDPANDGTSPTVTATITNSLHEDFEHAQIKFRVPANLGQYEVDAGTITQRVDEWGVATCYVDIAVPATTTVSVTIDSTAQSQGGPEPTALALRQNWPNPARTGTTVRFVLASAADVRIEVYAVSGRKVSTLTDGPWEAGEHDLPWDLRDEAGRDVASGIYVCRLETEGDVVAKKIVVLR